MAVVPKRDSLPNSGWAAVAACDVTGAMRSPPSSDFVMVIIVLVMLGSDDDLKINWGVSFHQIRQKKRNMLNKQEMVVLVHKAQESAGSLWICSLGPVLHLFKSSCLHATAEARCVWERFNKKKNVKVAEFTYTEVSAINHPAKDMQEKHTSQNGPKKILFVQNLKNLHYTGGQLARGLRALQGPCFPIDSAV